MILTIHDRVAATAARLDSGTPDGWADQLGDERGSAMRKPVVFIHLRAWPSGGFYTRGAHGKGVRRLGPPLPGGGTLLAGPTQF